MSTHGKLLNIYILTIFDGYDRILSVECEVTTLTEENKITEEGSEKTQKQSKKRLAKPIIACILVLAASLLFFFLLWLINRYDDVQFDQILYQMKAPVSGTSSTIVVDAIVRIGLFGILVATAEILLYLLLAGKLGIWLGKSKRYIVYSASCVARFFKKAFMPFAAMMLVLSFAIFILRLGIHTFVANAVTKSSFIESNYADPQATKLTFPEEKRNLIYIFLESMESTFADTSAGGNVTDNLIPELTELAEQNVSFSLDGKRGAYCYGGTGWTAASLFAQTSGVIMKVPLNFDNYATDGTYMPGITTLGDILADAGYEQSVLFGSDAGFGARDVYFTEHGNYNIIDHISLMEDGKLEDGYHVWWGFEDQKLFDFAKEEILRLSETGKPFNFTTLTADTHFPDGYECELCPDKYEQQYSNVISCSSRQVYDFINWIKEQPFYENTTIILSGDHLTMDPEFLNTINGGYVRTTYNCIINPAVQPARELGREFATFDMFPTTLAALGVSIEGDKLGLGVNLFSNVNTLTEEYGYDKLDDILSKASDFYIETFYSDETENDY